MILCRYSWLVLAGVLLSGCVFWTRNTDPIQIVLIGDSITQGRRGNPEQNQSPTISWRYYFWQKLVADKIRFDLVGSRQSGFEGDPPWPQYQGQAFDRDHEARWGAPTEVIAAQVSIGLQSYRPDLALILLGTNDVRLDQAQGKDPVQATQADMTHLIQLLRQANPDVVIVLGEPFQPWDPFPAIAVGYQQLATQLSTPRSPILTVKTQTDWISDPDKAETCTVDWVHPNIKGDKLIAEAFYQGIKPFLKSLPHP
ncbi:MAG: GDSL-type esterase/lipase family protein [Synechocystis sp.]|nr:GDSL-type esterase/lipase family protein [Synechocystis sp.]